MHRPRPSPHAARPIRRHANAAHPGAADPGAALHLDPTLQRFAPRLARLITDTVEFLRSLLVEGSRDAALETLRQLHLLAERFGLEPLCDDCRAVHQCLVRQDARGALHRLARLEERVCLAGFALA